MTSKFVRRIKGNYVFGKKQNDLLVYEYRGYEYDIEDIPAYKRPAWYPQSEHREEQKRIDAIINEKEHPVDSTGITFEEELDEIWELLGWK